MLLTIDVGNTSTGIAVFDGDEIVFKNQLPTPDEISVAFMKSLIKKKFRRPVAHVIVSSVVPFVDDSLRISIREYFKREPVFIDHSIETGLSFKIDNPRELGADRIADAVGGLHFFDPPIIIVDSGTATTFDLVSRDLEYLGGSIFPGVELSINSLAQNTARLGRVHFRTPDSILATNTEDHIIAGIYYSFIGALTYMIEEYKKITGPGTRVIATGGLVRHFEANLRGIDRFEPDLLFYGLKRIFTISGQGGEASQGKGA